MNWAKFDLTKPVSLRFKVVWITAILFCCAWFIFWIYYDVGVWNKSLAQVNPLNYAGLSASAALFLGWIVIGKIMQKRKPKQQTINILQTPLPVQTSLTETSPQVAPKVESIGEAELKTKKASSISNCSYSFGYLHNRDKTKEIPLECLVCQKVMQCMSIED